MTQGIRPWTEVVSFHPDVVSENFFEDIFALDLDPLECSARAPTF